MNQNVEKRKCFMAFFSKGIKFVFVFFFFSKIISIKSYVTIFWENLKNRLKSFEVQGASLNQVEVVVVDIFRFTSVMIALEFHQYVFNVYIEFPEWSIE